MARLFPLFVSGSLSPFSRVPASIRVYLLFFTTVLLISLVPPTHPTQITFERFITAIGFEFLLGLSIVFGIQMLFASLSFAGRIVDMQVGFGAAGIIDPLTRQTEALIGTLVTTVAMLVFFLSNMHHTLLSALTQSMQIIPVGQASFNLTVSTLISAMSTFFLLGVMMFIPVITGLLMIDTLIAYASRTMPQMNVYFVTLPLKIFIGLFLLSIALNYSAPLFQQMHTQLSLYWRTLLGG